MDRPRKPLQHESAFAVFEVAADAQEAALPHRCRAGDGGTVDAPIPYALGERSRAQLADGEAVPATARCRICGERVFVSLVDPASRTARRMAARPDPRALRAPIELERFRQRTRATPPARPAPRPAPAHEPCPACGIAPDDFGICRCSL